MLTKRTIQLGDYNTSSHGWTLSAWALSEPTPVTKLQDVPGRIKGPLDMSTILTGGQPVYESRSLSVTLETSEGDRLEREARISDIINRLHGRRVQVIIPDRPNYYAVGTLTVARKYNDPAHGSVEVAGTCEPWLYAMTETVVPLQATEAVQTTTLLNQGVMPVVPVLQVEGGSVTLAYNGVSLVMDAGTYKWPDLYLTSGEHVVAYTGAGTLIITYREAVLR